MLSGLRMEVLTLYMDELLTLGNMIKLDLSKLQVKSSKTHQTQPALASLFTYKLWSVEGQFTAETVKNAKNANIHTHADRGFDGGLK